MKINRAGFIIIIVVAFLAVLLIAAVLIVNIGCGEILQTNAAKDSSKAMYTAISGAEMLYSKLKSKEGNIVTWPQTDSGTIYSAYSGGTAMGTYSAIANTVTTNVFGIVSTGTYNGKTSRVTVKYGFDSPYTNGYPIGCIGSMTLSGQKWLLLRSWVRAEGPLAAGETVTTNNFVKVSGDILENQLFNAPSFWLGAVGDTNNDGSYIVDVNGDGSVTTGDVGSGQEAIFAADDINNDGSINDNDAFIHYYTVFLDNPANNSLGQDLGLSPGEASYYNGDQTFDPWSVPAGTPIIFVNGNVDIAFSDTAWWGGDYNHTIVATGNINIVQPTNGSQDTLALIAYGSVNTGGIRAFGGVRGNLVVYAHSDFNAYYGGRTDGTIFASGDVDIDTVLPIPGLLNRDLNRGDADWSDPTNWPLGLPPSYNQISLSFRIMNEASEFTPIWQRER